MIESKRSAGIPWRRLFRSLSAGSAVLHGLTSEMCIRILGLVVVSTLVDSGTAVAQHFNFDAREIGIGGISGGRNIASKTVEKRRRYHTLPLPFGLIETLSDANRSETEVNPIHVGEDSASPLHYTFGRHSGETSTAFAADVRDGVFSRDLNKYRGFTPANELVAEGRVMPNWGKTFQLRPRDNGMLHGIYVGAGPYLQAQGVYSADKRLTDLLASSTPIHPVNDTFTAGTVGHGQAALAITGGYRGRMPWPGRPVSDTSDGNGIYLAANANYLQGFGYVSSDLMFRFDTDSEGLIARRPATPPMVIDYMYSRSGSGFALDLGGVAVLDRWEFGLAINGVGNRIAWTDVERSQFTTTSLVDGEDLVEQKLPTTSVTVKLPVDYAGDVAYTAGVWSAMGQLSHGFTGFNFHAGVERRFGRIEIRGGGRYSRDRWFPHAGVGYDLTPRVSLDVAVFGTSTNIERHRKASLAVSLRLNPGELGP